MGPVERSIRGALAPPVTLRTSGRNTAFVLDAIDERGVVLLLGRSSAHTRLTWNCLESVPVFLRKQGGWVPAGGRRSVAGEPGTVDEHLKKYPKRDVAHYVPRVLSEAGVVTIDAGLSLRLRAD